MLLIKQTHIFFHKNYIIFSNINGLVIFNIENYINFFNFKLVNKKLYLENANVKLKLNNLKIDLESKIDNILLNLNSVFKKKLLLFGIGFRSWIYNHNNNFKYLILKIGFSRDLFIKIPLDIKIICLKPTLIIIKGFNKHKLNQFASFLHSLKVPDSYKGKGVQYLNESIILKPGKKN